MNEYTNEQLIIKIRELEHLLAESQKRQRRDEKLWMNLVSPPIKKIVESDSGG